MSFNAAGAASGAAAGAALGPVGAVAGGLLGGLGGMGGGGGDSAMPVSSSNGDSVFNFGPKDNTLATIAIIAVSGGVLFLIVKAIRSK